MLVTVEGIDGAGKSTVIDSLRGDFPDAVFTREPTSSWIGQDVEKALGDGSTDPLSDLFLFVADHADHLERVVRPALEDGELVVCDRYVDSRCAYQGETLGDDGRFGDKDATKWVRQLHQPWSVEPDLTLLLDLSVEEAVERASGEAKYEHADFLEGVAENFRKMAERHDRFVVVDAIQGEGEVAEECRSAVESFLRSSTG